MKNTINLILIGICLMAFYSSIAQESRSSLVFSGSFMHFQKKEGHAVVADVSSISGYYLFPLNPGLGVFYQYQIFRYRRLSRC